MLCMPVPRPTGEAAQLPVLGPAASFGVRTILKCQLVRPQSRWPSIGRMGGPSNGDGLGPAKDKAGVFLQRVGDRPWRMLQLVPLELFCRGLVRGDDGTLRVTLGGQGRPDGSWSSVWSRFGPRSKYVLELDIHVGQDELLFDELPDTTGHLIAVHLQHRLSHLDLVVGRVAPGLVLQVGACRPGWPRARVSAESGRPAGNQLSPAGEQMSQAGGTRAPATAWAAWQCAAQTWQFPYSFYFKS